MKKRRVGLVVVMILSLLTIGNARILASDVDTLPDCSTLTINVPSQCNINVPFVISGAALLGCENPQPELYVYLEIVSPDDPELFFVESQVLLAPEGGQYSTDMTLYMPNPDGTYLIRAYLMNSNWDYVGYAEREIEFVK